MFVKSSVGFGVFLAMVVAAAPASGQSCSGLNSCNITTTASVNVPVLVDLNVAGAGAITLTSPTVADFATGYVQDAGPAITVKANRTWTLSIHTSNVTDWTYTAGGQSGVKPIGDLTWSTTAGGSYTPVTNSATNVVTAQPKGTQTPTIFFRTLYDSDFGAAKNTYGSYSIPLVFTLSAP